MSAEKSAAQHEERMGAGRQRGAGAGTRAQGAYCRANSQQPSAPTAALNQHNTHSPQLPTHAAAHSLT